MANKPSSINYSDSDLKNIEVIIDHGYARNRTQAVSAALAHLAKKISPQYNPITSRKHLPKEERDMLSASKTLDREEARKKAKAEKEQEEFIRVMEAVKGEETTNFAGETVCRYWVYTKEKNINGEYIEAYEEEFYPHTASEWHITNQFRDTDQKQVEELRAQGKVKVI